MELISRRKGLLEGDVKYLTVVKCAFHSQIMYVLVSHGGHLGLLNRRYTALGMQNEYRNVVLIPESIDRGTGRIIEKW